MTNLLALYPSILAPIVIEFVNDVDLCCLDSAVTNTKLRPSFLDFVSKCSIINTNLIRCSDNEYYEWIKKRGMSLKKIKIHSPGELSSDGLICQILHRMHILYLESPDYNELTTFLTLTKPTIETLKLSCEGISQLIPTLKAIKNLQHLDLTGSEDLTEEDISSVVTQYCSDLKQLTIPRYLNERLILESVQSLDQVDCKLSGFDSRIPDNLFHNCSFVRVQEVTGSSIISCAGQNYSMTALFCKHSYGREDTTLYFAPYVDGLMSLNLSFGNCWATNKELLSAVSTRCKLLTTLRLQKVYFHEGNFVSLIKSCKQLRTIHLDQCEPITPLDVNAVAENCAALVECTIYHPNLSEIAALNILEKCKCLTMLCIGEFAVTEKSINALAGQVNVVHVGESLFFGLTDGKSVTYSTMSAMPELHKLTDPNHSFQQISVLHKLVEVNPKLQQITLFELAGVDNGTVQLLVSCCPFLKAITFHQCKKLTGQFLEYLHQCKHLTKLSITGMNDVTDDMMQHLLLNQPNLTSFTFSRSGMSSAAWMTTLGKHCPLMRQVNVSYVRAVQDCHVIEFLAACPYLNSLNLDSCCVTANILRSLANRSNMRYLNVSGTGITGAELDDFQSRTGFRCSVSLVCR